MGLWVLAACAGSSTRSETVSTKQPAPRTQGVVRRVNTYPGRESRRGEPATEGLELGAFRSFPGNEAATLEFCLWPILFGRSLSRTGVGPPPPPPLPWNLPAWGPRLPRLPAARPKKKHTNDPNGAGIGVLILPGAHANGQWHSRQFSVCGFGFRV